MSNKKRKNAILALSIAAVAATTTTVVYFYFRNVLKYMVVKNKVDGSGNPVAIPYSAIDFKNKWENDGLKFDTPVFQTYFEQRFNYKNINSVAKNIKLELSLSDDLQNVILTVTLTKKFGKTETRQFTLIGFTANQKAKELNDFIKNLNIDVNGKNKLPSEVTESNLSPITDPNKDKYDITHKLVPNDETGELKVVTTVTSKEDPNVTKTVEKTITNFKKDTIPASAVLGYTPKSLIANLMSTHEIENATATLQGGTLKAKLEEYGSFDDSLLNGLSYEIRSAKKVSDNNIEELNLTYTVSKQVIIGKNDDNSFKYGTLIEERTIKVSFETAIVSEHNARMQDYVSYVNSKIALKQGYNHNKLASTYDENNDWEIDKTLDSKYFTITFEQVDKSDTNKEVKLRMVVKSKLLATEISSQANLTLLDFFEDKPTKKLSVTAKNDGHVTNLDDYLAPNKYKDITENINYPSDNGWTLKDNSITVQKDPLDEKTLIFNYVVEKNVVESSLSATTQLLSHNGQVKVFYASIINKNKGDEFSKLLANIVIGYQGTKPRIDKVDNSKFTVDYKAPFTATDFPNYEIVGVDTSSIKFNYKDGKLFIKATIKDKKTNTITSSEMELVDGFLPFAITDDNLLKGNLKTDIPNISSMQDVLDKFSNKTDAWQILSDLQTMLDNYSAPNAAHTFSLTNPSLTTNGNKLIFKYTMNVNVPINDAPSDNKTGIISKEDTKEFDFTNILKKNLDKDFATLTFDLANSVKSTATTTFASEVAKAMSSFTVTSSQAGFDQNKYDWLVETNPNDVDGKLFARITMISKQDSTIRNSITLNSIPTQFKVYIPTQIASATAKNNLNVTSAQEILDKILAASDKDAEVRKYIDYVYTGDETIQFSEQASDYSINGYKVKFGYRIFKQLNRPNNFEDTHHPYTSSAQKNIEVDFETQIKARISENIDSLLNDLTFDITDKSKLASTVTDANITTTSAALPSGYQLSYYWLDPNDKTGKLKVHAKITHVGSNISKEKEVEFSNFKKDDTFGFTYGISYDITYLESIMNQVLTNFANGNQTQKLANMKLFFKYDSTVVDSNITSKTLSYDTTSKVATYVFDYKKKVVTSRAQNGTLGYEEITFQNQTMSRSFYNFFEIMRWQNTFTVCAYCLNSRGRGPLCEEADGYRHWLYAELNKGTSDTQLASILATHKSNALNYLPRYKAINRHDGYENQHSHRPELQPNYYFQYTS